MNRQLRNKLLKFRGPEELGVRSFQYLAALTERRGWSSLAKLPTDQEILKLFRPLGKGRETRSPQELFNLFRERTNPPFFSAFTDSEATVRELRSRWPNKPAQIVQRANRLCEGRFDLLGFRDLRFGDCIDWHLEPIAGKRSPLLHWSQLDYLDAQFVGDKKIIWELNRHQYFVTLGQAYWLTGDERYAQTFITHLSSWMDQNPPSLGINWASSLEIALRSISWLWAFYFFKGSPAVTSGLFLQMLKFLYLQARHIEIYLSTYFSPNTHLTGEGLGLFYLGTLLPEFHSAARWRETGRKILLEQLPRHVRPDGVYFEQSSYYHRYTTDFYTHFYILLLANRYPISAKLELTLKLLLDHLMYITRPDGTTPLFGDDDGGKLLMVDGRPANDFRAALSTGAVLFGRSDYRYVAGEVAEETLWLLGAKGVGDFDLIESRQPEFESVAFQHGGYYVMRDGWSKTSNYLLFDCGPHGEVCGAHAHADALSFDLSVRGRPVLVDPGTFTYTGSKEARDWFRSSPAHNTLTVDGESSSVSEGPFSWKTIARAQLLAWISRPRFDYVEAEHDGYKRLVEPVCYQRAILFLKNDYWLIRDRVKSGGDHSYDLWFHFSTTQNVRSLSDNALCCNAQGAALQICSFARGARWRTEKGWLSNRYGEKSPAHAQVFSATGRDQDFLTFLLPLDSAETLKQVAEIETIGGRGFEIISENELDVVMIRRDSRVETARLASDFQWTWVRFSREAEDTPEELVLIGGQKFSLNGQEILRSERRLKFLIASRLGDQFRVETEDGIFDLSAPGNDFAQAFFELRSLSKQ